MIAELSHLAATLNKATDTYTEALSQLEKKLKSLNLGIEAWVTLDETCISGSTTCSTSVRTMLGYAKTVPNGWGFVVQKVRVERGLLEGDPCLPWQQPFEEEQPRMLLQSS